MIVLAVIILERTALAITEAERVQLIIAGGLIGAAVIAALGGVGVAWVNARLGPRAERDPLTGNRRRHPSLAEELRQMRHALEAHRRESAHQLAEHLAESAHALGKLEGQVLELGHGVDQLRESFEQHLTSRRTPR